MSSSTEKIEIPFSKRKILFLFLGSLFAVCAGVWFVLDPDAVRTPFLRSPQLVFIVGLAAVLFFGLGAIFLFLKMWDKKPGLVLDAAGLTDHTSWVAVGFIPWTDLQEVAVIEIYRQKLILLHLKNPQQYIDLQTNRYKRKLMQMNYNNYGTPISISAASIQIKVEELLEMLNSRKDAK